MMATTIYLAFVGLILTFSTSWVVGSAYASVSSTAPVASFVAIDHGFQGPDTLRAGLTTLRLHNRGREPHQLQLLKLTEGKSPGDLAASLPRLSPASFSAGWPAWNQAVAACSPPLSPPAATR